MLWNVLGTFGNLHVEFPGPRKGAENSSCLSRSFKKVTENQPYQFQSICCCYYVLSVAYCLTLKDFMGFEKLSVWLWKSFGDSASPLCTNNDVIVVAS